MQVNSHMRYPIESIDRMFDQLRHDMFELRGSLAESWPELPEMSFNTAVDLTTRDDAFVVTVDMPGFERDDIDLRYEEGRLWLAAEHESGDETTSRRRSIAEQVAIPREIEVDEVTASYHHGVLEVRLPFVEGAAERGHRIDVE